MLALSGIALTELPPSIIPTLNEVLGDSGAGYAANLAMARPRACTGFTVPKSPQECPPGPMIVTLKRLDPSARLVIRSRPGPTSETKASTLSRKLPPENRCLTPRRLPSPSSPTVAAKHTLADVSIRAADMVLARLNRLAIPQALSLMPGAYRRLPWRLTLTSVSSGKTVSRWAEITTV